MSRLAIAAAMAAWSVAATAATIDGEALFCASEAGLDEASLAVANGDRAHFDALSRGPDCYILNGSKVAAVYIVQRGFTKLQVRVVLPSGASGLMWTLRNSVRE